MVVQQILEEACEFLHEQRRPLSPEELARGIGLDSSEIAEVVEALQREGLIAVSGGEINLTEKGAELGGRIARKHNLLERFLLSLGLKKSQAHEEACRLEHALSDSLERELGRRLPDPGKSSPAPDRGGSSPAYEAKIGREPWGHLNGPIAGEKGVPAAGEKGTADGERSGPGGEKGASGDLLALAELQEGEQGVVEIIYGGQNLRRRLTDLGLTPGTLVTLLRKGPGGPVELRVRETSLALGRGIAAKIFLRRVKT